MLRKMVLQAAWCLGIGHRMIASYKYNFIFIKTRKTAGTSIELALSELCGPEDIITPIGKLGVQRAKRGVFPRNYCKIPELEAAYADALRARDYPRMLALRVQIARSGCLNSHAGVDKTSKWVGEEFWNSAYKFTAERHPYAKAASLARHAFRRDMPFADHLNRIIFQLGEYMGHPMYMRDGKVLVDAFVRQEFLEQDFETVRHRCELPPMVFSRARDDQPGETARIVKSLTQEQRDHIYEKCAPEFELLGWERW